MVPAASNCLHQDRFSLLFYLNVIKQTSTRYVPHFEAIAVVVTYTVFFGYTKCNID